jgi:hypothetical protein
MEKAAKNTKSSNIGSGLKGKKEEVEIQSLTNFDILKMGNK